MQDNYLAYDEAGRLRLAYDGRVSLRYEYDHAGNRVRLVASYRNDSDKEKNFTYGYAYDGGSRHG